MEAQLRIASYWLFKKPHGENYGSWLTVQNSGFVEPGFGFTMKGVDGMMEMIQVRVVLIMMAGATAANALLKDSAMTLEDALIQEQLILKYLPNDEILIGNPYPSCF